MYSTLLPKIQTTLEACDKLGAIYNHPPKDITAYPCAIYYPTNFDNEFLTNAENLKGFNFTIYIVNETKIATMQTAINTILARAVDQVIEQFDEDWNQGVLDGHRIWWRLTTGEWIFSEEDNGIVVSARLNLTVNLMTNN